MTRRRDHDWVVITLSHVSLQEAALAAAGVTPSLEADELRGPICYECETEWAKAGEDCP